jgi:glutamate dehydrogenase (NAD(P)+)
VNSTGALNGWSRHSMLAFEEAAAVLDLEPWIVQRLRYPVHESTAYLQITRDSGDVVCVPFLAVHHNDSMGRTAGSLSLAPGLQLRDCQVVGMERTWQSALLGLPFGGASYGLVFDPSELSERELIALVRPLAHQFSRCRDNVVLLPGRSCMRELLGRLSAETRDHARIAVTGKPDCLGGLDHSAFAAEGIAATISVALRHMGRPSIGARVAIQGFGELGQALSRRLVREGMKVVALSDQSGAVYRADGLIVSDITHRVAREQVLFGYAEADHVTRAAMMQLDADVLVLTNGSHEVNESNCSSLVASLVVEADYAGISDTAREVLLNKSVLTMPWVLANCGTLLASYFEVYGSEIRNTPEELLNRCYGVTGQAVERVLCHAEKAECYCEQATYRLAIEEAANRLRICGL